MKNLLLLAAVLLLSSCSKDDTDMCEQVVGKNALTTGKIIEGEQINTMNYFFVLSQSGQTEVTLEEYNSIQKIDGSQEYCK